ncbi:MAG TPA: hypothetical protein VJQ77_07645 [Novosphingobium sp.]|nr:hypothetical protein [Novosphingobium sp.]
MAACSVSPGSVASAPGKAASSRAPAVRAPSRAAPPAPKFQTIPGLEGVIGADRRQLISRFGTPRLDVWEGDARKLQFTGNACVLDIYLYPTPASREPLATFLDARRASDGQDVDRAACVAALRQP